MIRLNKLEKMTTSCILAVAIFCSNLIVSHWLSNRSFYIAANIGNVVNVHLFGSATKGWGFTKDNITSPGPTIFVKEGDLVNLTLTSVDGARHNFFIDYDRDTNPSNYEPTSPSFKTTTNYQFDALVPGNFTYYCQYYKVSIQYKPGNIQYKPGTMFGTFIVQPVERTHTSNIYGKVEDTDLKLNGEIIISGVGTFTFIPREVVTKTPDIFQPGHFSVFDIIAHLDETERIAVEYHFDERMNTHVIDSINGKENWWYQVYYDGGWPEPNVFRMDHYPVKDKMYMQLYQTSPSEIEKTYAAFRNQIARRESSSKMVIAEVTIKGKYETLSFKNVTVEAHNLRNDTFKPGVVTAIDVMLSLGEQGKISYDLRWYRTIAFAEVKNYYVDRINKDEAYGSCGFVYECGEKLRSKNHIHLPSDIRVINSPEYVKWFWICI